jgi:hypothetical protein
MDRGKNQSELLTICWRIFFYYSITFFFQFLEALPPIEVFVGLEALRSSAEEVPGLPTRVELQQWMTEHDAIEKETEIFDTGELTKLRQLTKGA